MGHITLGVKHAGERSAGNPPAAFDVAGAGNVTMVAGRRAMAKAVEEPPEPRCARLFSTLLMREGWREPVFYSTLWIALRFTGHYQSRRYD